MQALLERRDVLTSWDGAWYMSIVNKGYPRTIQPNVTFDVLDARVAELEGQKDDLLESAGKLDPSKLKKVEGDLTEAKKDINDIVKAIDKRTKVELKPPPKPAASAKAGE